MTKRQLIDQIITVNRSARPGFLAAFDDHDLRDYLDHLHAARQPRLTGQSRQYARYFAAAPAGATALAEPPEDDDLPPAPRWSAGESDLADPGPAWDDEAPGEDDPAGDATFVYEHESPPPPAEATYDDEAAGEQGDEDPLEDVAIAATEYAEAPLDSTDEDMESWLF